MLLKSFSRHRSDVRFRDTYFVLFLCVCVVLLMLGVPSTLLSLGDSPDLIPDVSLEGWSLPQTPLDLHADSQSSMLSSSPVARYRPILLTSVFHPPLA